MPSDPLDPPPSSPAAAAGSPLHHHRRRLLLLLPSLLLAILFLFLLLILCVFLYRKLSRSRTAPASDRHSQLRRFSYSLLRRATGSFSPATLLGHGGFGAVHKATLPTPLAVKLMDPTRSPHQQEQGEREFRNEISLAHLTLTSPYLLSLLGFSSNRKGDRLLLVYELMSNRSLQESLLETKCPELTRWGARLAIALDVARGLEYLHHSCDPPVIHGDIKPSNVLLDADFRAKIGDFGLARLKKIGEEDRALDRNNNTNGEAESVKRLNVNGDDNGSILEETESVLTGHDEGSDQSTESCVIKVLDSEPEPGIEKVEKGTNSRRDWWWKQETGGGVKDYVMEWIGSEIKKERPKSSWVVEDATIRTESEKKKRWKWWSSSNGKEVRAARKPREWWKEEFCNELSRKAKKKKNNNKRGHSSSKGDELWWQNENEEDLDESEQERKKRKSNSRSSIDWWLEGLSGEMTRYNGRRNSQEDVNIPKSGAVSSTPSMRGTVCYIAPEYGGGGSMLSEKCDVYSFGVLLLVLVSGRRPLQVTGSPMSEFERANLISWARQLACNGRLLDLVDKSVHSLEEDQAVLCITIALLCLQRSPSKRPSMRQVVGMLLGEAGPPQLPFEFSPSPPSNVLFKSRKKAR